MTNSPTPLSGSVKSAALPSALADLTERVIRGTRLWRSEKKDVRAELESHFREGLEELALEGLSQDAAVKLLCESFGNPDLTAKLIRRGKKRGRPMILKLAISASLAVLGVAGAGGAYVAYLAYAKPNPSVDYLKELNEPTAKTPEQERAWPVLRDTLLQLKPMPESLSALTPADLQPGSAEWKSVQAWLDLNRPLLPSLKDAATKPYYGFIYGGSDTGEFMRRIAEAANDAELLARASQEPDPLEPRLISVLLPHLAEVRKAAWFLIYNARDLVSAGNFADAFDSLDISHRLASKLFEGRTLIEQLVGAAVMRLTGEELRRILSEHGDAVPPDVYSSILTSHLFTMQDDLLVAHLEGERLMFKDAVQYVFTDDGQGNGRLIPSQFDKMRKMGIATESEPAIETDAELIAVAARHADRVETLAKYDELWETMAKYRSLPLNDPDRYEGERMIKRFAESEDGRRFEFITTMLPSLNYADQVVRECAMDNAATRAVVLLAKAHAATLAWPGAADVVIPSDAHGDGPLKYRIAKDGRPLLYSVWRDGRDDGGSIDPIADISRPPSGQKTPADMIYFPVPAAEK